MRDNDDDPYESTARSRPTLVGIHRDIHMLAVAAALFLNYYFMHVRIEIDSMRSVLVFVRPLVG